MVNSVDRRQDFPFEGAMLVASSRKGTTQNVRLVDGRLVEVYFLKSGRVEVEVIDVINPALTLRGEEPY